MIRNRDIINCLPLLASVLGDRYGVKVRVGGARAYTNGKTIHIPGLPLDCDKTAISLAKGYIDHESAHIRFTDFDSLSKLPMLPVTRHLCNSIEDWRVEKRMGEKYPGCRNNLTWLAKHIFRDEYTEEAGNNPASSILNYVLLSVRSWEVEELYKPLSKIRLTVEGYLPGLCARLDDILLRVRQNCPDTMASVNYAREITQLIRDYEAMSPEGNENGKEESQSCSSVLNEASKTVDNEEVPISQERCEEEGSSLKSLLEAGEEELPASLAEMLADKLSENACENEQKGITVAESQNVRIEALPLEEEQYALQSSNALRHRLVGLLQAKELRHIALARKGKLNNHKLAYLYTGNTKIFNKEAFSKGQNTVVHILLDASYSMDHAPIKLARQACYAVAKALSSFKGINPAVTVFPANSMGGVYSILKHGQIMSNRFLVEANGGTPLAQALWWVLQTIYPLPETRKIVLLITDGIPDNIKAAKDAIITMTNLGVEIYGIGIQSECLSFLLPITGKSIWKLQDLPATMFEILQKSLCK